MQAYKIALFLFMLNWTLAMFAGTPFFGSALDIGNLSISEGVYTWSIDGGGINESDIVPGHDSETLNLSGEFKDYQPEDIGALGLLGAVTMFITAVVKSTALLPFFLDEIGIPLILNMMITAGSWMTYGYAIVQFIRGIGGKTIT